MALVETWLPSFDWKRNLTETQKEANRTNQSISFPYTTCGVRVILMDGVPWFVTADVCAVLELSNPTKSLLLLDDDEKGLTNIQGISRGNDQANVINESGLYSLILTSRKPEAKKFKKWVTNEVLPAIRKTGQYVHQAESYTRATPEQLADLKREIRHAFVGWIFQNENDQWFYNRLRAVFNIHRFEDLPAESLRAVKLMIKERLPERPDWKAIQSRIEQAAIGGGK